MPSRILSRRTLCAAAWLLLPACVGDGTGLDTEDAASLVDAAEEDASNLQDAALQDAAEQDASLADAAEEDASTVVDAAEYDASDSLDAAECDAASDAEAGADRDAACRPEAALCDVGAPCADSGQRACREHDGRLSLVCLDGAFQPGATCDASQRCDTRFGATQGQCLAIVPECAARSPGAAFCREAERMICGVDRVSADSDPCGPQQYCVESAQGVSCIADSDECALDTHDCDHDPNACVNTLGGYACQCPEGYEGSGMGESGCTDVEDCSVNHGGCDTSPLATCNEGLGTPPTCTCPSGYEGNGVGDDGCVDIDECATLSVCDETAGSCTNLPGTFECACRPPYLLMPDGQSCRLRAWGTPEPIDPGGYASVGPAVAIAPAGEAVAAWAHFELLPGPGYSSSASMWANRRTAGTWDSEVALLADLETILTGPAVAADSLGNATAVWYYSQGQSVSVWASRYEAESGWTVAAAIETDDSSNVGTGNVVIDNSLPAVVVDAAGSITAVFRLDDGLSSRIWANRYELASGWGSAHWISTYGGNPSMPDVAVDSAGNILAVWTRSGQIWANRYTPADGWGTDAPVEPGAGIANWPRVGLDDSGNAIAVWERGQIIASRYTPESGWSAQEAIPSPASGTASPPALAVHSSGDAVAVWFDSAGADGHVWASRYLHGEGWSTAEPVSDGSPGVYETPSIGMDAMGNVLVVWPYGRNTWANYYVVGSGWIGATPIATGPIDTHNGVVAMNDAGNAVAVWVQRDSAGERVWANHFE